jgi:hypothetical protein
MTAHRTPATTTSSTTTSSATASDTGDTGLSAELLTAWHCLLVNRLQPYAAQQADGTYRWVYEACTPQLLQAHLAGEITLALSSTDAQGGCRWLCLDADQADALPHLVSLATALTAHGLPGLVEASRRGGHLWLLLDAPVPAAVARHVVLETLDALQRGGLAVPRYELYPDTAAEGARALGHAVRLPLGIHRLTGRRYVLFNEYGYPCAFSSTEAALRFVLAWPRVSAEEVVRRDQELGQCQPPSADPDDPDDPDEHAAGPPRPHGRRTGVMGAGAEQERRVGRVGTHSPVIRWVDTQISPLDLLADLAPETELRRVGRGYLGWCPFHDDRAPDAAGRPGTPSFYVVHDRRYGWSWRCLSSNCPQSWGPMRHSFELFQRLLGLTVRSAIVEACQRWPEVDGEGPAGTGAVADAHIAETTAAERMG